ncbi:hypothetical protein [Brevibacillus centrosporus]|uniref:Uncharacterized protein n=1 Tax=Brevibacillus centrosporus TaxID=54910 RepID=A0A1I3WFL9_9BACL|nr:hypothetical protein [Brevibacillus centrosporus]MEC2130950.1 hypothetical protein [Brevibacillus centrosporus]RNB63388.1 hypothetical protein EDM55_28855 [Brevibacillus centrosporus]GED31337.1 hypothetical protein BCE02nite_24780 [Brevibacillus centrosporus]SFK05236.1 hypothetical protein SAMN05518846_10854 [Brevibacillus centrosporus]
MDREHALLLPNELELLLESEGFQVIGKTTHDTEEKDYDRDRWQHGGYPFVRSTDASAGGTHWTVIAKKISGIV